MAVIDVYMVNSQVGVLTGESISTNISTYGRADGQLDISSCHLKNAIKKNTVRRLVITTYPALMNKMGQNILVNTPVDGRVAFRRLFAFQFHTIEETAVRTFYPDKTKKIHVALAWLQRQLTPFSVTGQSMYS